MREPGHPPHFETLERDLARAREAWTCGDMDRAERILRVLASKAYAESFERGPNDPVPEANPYDVDNQPSADAKQPPTVQVAAWDAPIDLKNESFAVSQKSPDPIKCKQARCVYPECTCDGYV